MEVELNHRLLGSSQKIEMTTTVSPHNKKRSPNKESQKSSSVLNQDSKKYEWQCPNCSQKAFLSKVDHFTTLLLTITGAIISGSIYWNVFQESLQKNVLFWLQFLPATLLLPSLIACCENYCQKVPLNLLLSLMLAIAGGLLLGVVSSFFAPMTVMGAGGITIFVTVMVSYIAQKLKLENIAVFAITDELVNRNLRWSYCIFCSQWDITSASVPSWIVIPVLAIFGILCIFNDSPMLQLIYGSLGTLTFAIHLMITRVEIRRDSPKQQELMDYAIPALKLYTDIVHLFFFIMLLMETVNFLEWGSQLQGQQ
ncbi:protein lifeguard 1-like [Carettochelys insculpta]|uniref:protein lifeguard 1-like n=1 Tax=Carettochelys insculpta TaxID=44489 RepID=UPI003EB7C17D